MSHSPAPLAPGSVILGLDPGVESLGWGVAVVAPDAKLYHKAHGCVHTLAKSPMPQRIDWLCHQVVGLIMQYRPTVIAAEAWVPYGGRAGAGGNTMRVSGAIRALGIAHGLRVVEYTAQAVKGLSMGNRNAEKADVQAAMQAYFGLARKPTPNHAADGLACTVAHYEARADGLDVVSKSVRKVPNTYRSPASG